MDQQKMGNFIAKFRKEKKMTQQELGEKLGVTDKTISRWETGKYMPDLSVFPLLSKELGISVNDLMNGQIVDKKEYQDTFESNIVKTISKIDKSNRNWKIVNIALIGIFVILCLWITKNCLFHYYTFVVKFDSSKIKITENSKGFDYLIEDSCSIDDRHLITNYQTGNEKVTVVFMQTLCNIDSYFNHKKNMRDNYDLTRPHNTSGSTIDLSYSNIASKYKVYYTSISFNKIRNADNDELKEIIKKSNLIYESE